ncbi:MAG: ferrous iron transporter B, partial [Bdellovibrionaceae bacterium]|nr:ferrous iron transporter B [Pseudobdellovibrionaceae bacterium]
VARSGDEEVTVNALFGGVESGPVDGVLVVVDGTQLERHLHLVLQAKAAGFSVGVIVTMADLLRKEGIQLDLQALSRELKVPVVAFEGILGGGLPDVVDEARKLSSVATVERNFSDFSVIQPEARRLAKVALSKVDRPEARLAHLSQRTRHLDRFFLNPWVGPVVFFLIMTSLFVSIYWLATPFMDAIDGGFSSLGEMAAAALGEGLFSDFIANGVIASFGAFMVFVPQIFILFFGIGLLESTGYLARAATLIDRPFSKIGLTGRSFVPILSGFSCAVPALIATRNISSRRDRWITQFIIPLMTCSARLPVYALMLGFIFVDDALAAGLGLAGLYFLALIVGAAAAAILNRLLPQEQGSLLLMELPLYRRPRVRVVARQAITRTLHYVKKAGPVIFVIAVLIWVGTTFPQVETEDSAVKMEESYAGQAGHLIEPIFEPMGVDWRVGVGLISAFAAREVFVSTLAVMFKATAEDEDVQNQTLLDHMRTATRASDGAQIFTPATVAGLLVFFVIALQCMSTFAVAKQESGSWQFAWVQLVSFNVVAYALAVLTVHGLRLFGIS